MKRVTLAFIVIASIVSSGCLTMPVSIAASNTPLHNKKIESNAGKTVGEDSTYSILGLWMLGRPDIGIALENAKKKKKADALINLRCYETTTWFLLFSRTTVTVEGDAIKFKQGKKK